MGASDRVHICAAADCEFGQCFRNIKIKKKLTERLLNGNFVVDLILIRLQMF